MPRMPHQPQAPDAAHPAHPLISDVLHRDTLERVVDIIELLESLDLSEGLTPEASAGLRWIHCMLADAIKHVGAGLKGTTADRVTHVDAVIDTPVQAQY